MINLNVFCSVHSPAEPPAANCINASLMGPWLGRGESVVVILIYSMAENPSVVFYAQ